MAMGNEKTPRYWLEAQASGWGWPSSYGAVHVPAGGMAEEESR